MGRLMDHVLATVSILLLAQYGVSSHAASRHSLLGQPAPVRKLTKAKLVSPTDPISFPPFRTYEGKLDGDGFPMTNAQLCIIRTNVCYNFAQHHRAKEYPFGMNPKAQKVQLNSGANLELFSATFSAGGSGSLEGVALLKYQRNGRLIDLTPAVTRTNQSDLKVWLLHDISSWPVLAVADYRWTKNETHFSNHFYTVQAYLFDEASNAYVLRLSYVTERKYAGLDESNQINVLNPEKVTIIQHLRAH